jgi:hypothetical protein
MNKNQYAKLRKAVELESVSFGTTTVTLFKEEELEKAQLGYSVHPNGESLCGFNDGDWKVSWLIIGDEDLGGDPIFTDLDSEELPIYTAQHGARHWRPILIAESFSSFVQVLEQFEAVSKGREHMIALQSNPLPEPEKDVILNRIRQDNPQAEINFWETWLAGFHE